MSKSLCLAVAIAASLSASVGYAAAEPRAVVDDQPLARIRGVPRSIELTPKQFGHWMRTMWRNGKPTRTAAAKGAATPPAMTDEFRLADADGNGRVTKDELADYLALPTTR